MLLLTSTSDLIQVITGSSGAVAVHASYTDLNGTTVTPGRTNTASITGATTTTIVASPASSTQRNVQYLSIRNTHATVTNLITVQHTDGTNVEILYKISLVAGAQCIYDGSDWVPYDINGNILTAQSATAQGSDKQVQVNSGGYVIGDPNFLWSATDDSMYIGKVTADPTAPTSGFMDWYVRQRAGRLNISFAEAGGVEQYAQSALWRKQVASYYPTSSTNGGTATLGGYGISWTAGGTVSHPTPAAGIVTQSLRTRYANVVTTTNQELGIKSTAAGLPRYTRGNGAGRGGFFLAVRYVIELWPANTCRIFVGMSDQSTGQVTLDIASMTGNFCAFAHDTTDGANIMWFITRDNTTTHKTSLAGVTIAAGQAFDFIIYCKPNDSTIYYAIYDVNASSWIVESSETNNLPTNTAFMGPQIEMSNGTANTTATTVAPSIVRLIIESDY